MSEPTEVFAAAFIKMQSELPEIEKDSKADAGRFSYKYASLPEIFRVVKPVLFKHGFALTQTSGSGCLVTALYHTSGEVLKSFIFMPSPETISPQDYGKAHSYYRRYEVNGMLGLAPDEDVDAGGVIAPQAINANKSTAPAEDDDAWTSPAPPEEVIADKSLLIEQAKENFVTIRNAYEEGPVWHRQILANYCDTKLAEGEKIGEAITTRMSVEKLQKLVDSQKVKIKTIGRK